MDKPIPEAVPNPHAATLRVYLAHLRSRNPSQATRPRWSDLCAALEAGIAALTAAQQQQQQQGQAVGGCPHCGGTGGHWEGCRAPVDIQPMQQGGGEVCETCDGAGHVVTYADPYDRGDVSSPEQSPCHACTAPPSAPVGAMTKDSRVPDDYRNQASGYRAGWNDALASDLARQPAAVRVEELSPIYNKTQTEKEARAAIGTALDDAAKALRVLSTMLKKERLAQGYVVADEILGSIGYAAKLNSALAQQPAADEEAAEQSQHQEPTT